MRAELSDKAFRRIAQGLEPSEDRAVVEHVREALEGLGFESLHDLIQEFKQVVAERDSLLEALERVQ